MENMQVRMAEVLMGLCSGQPFEVGSGEADTGEPWVNLVDGEGFIRASLSLSDGRYVLNVAGVVNRPGFSRHFRAP